MRVYAIRRIIPPERPPPPIRFNAGRWCRRIELRSETLHEFLDSGEPVTVLPYLGLLAEAIVVEGRGRDSGWLADSAARCRELAARLRRSGDHQQLAMALGWAAEAYEDHHLARRFEKALPHDLVVELLAAEEPAEHSHRLLVTSSRSFTCAACTNLYTDTTAVRVDATEYITFCPHCIGIAALAVAPPQDVGSATMVPSRPSSPSSRELAAVPRARVQVLAAVAFVAATVLTSAGLESAGLLPSGLQDVVHRMLTPFGMDVPPPPKPSDQPPAPAPASPLAPPAPRAGEAGDAAVTELPPVVVSGQRAVTTAPGHQSVAEAGAPASAPPALGSTDAVAPSGDSPPPGERSSAEEAPGPAGVGRKPPDAQPSIRNEAPAPGPEDPALAPPEESDTTQPPAPPRSVPIDAPLSPPPVTDVPTPEGSLDEPPSLPDGDHTPPPEVIEAAENPFP